ncbi:MAG: SurA N-terminal domain-containing protein [Bdellovibrionota bacterium]|nr:MAG: SurA N-terminal domain-containing protein [Bdellovibrionota bacterium]
MLQIFHKYRRTFLGVLILAVVVLIMTGFGLDYYARRDSAAYAIKVNETEISFPEVDRARELMENHYRRILGDNYYELIDQFNINIPQQVVDKTINDEILGQFAGNLGLRVGDEELVQAIATQFPQGFDSRMYASMLSQLRMNSAQFEAHMRKELLTMQLLSLLQHAAIASKREIESMMIQSESKYDLQYVAFDPAQYAAAVPAPADEELRSYFEEHQTRYELPERVAYSYIRLSPKDFLAQVPVSDDDIELFYSENEKRFSDPEQARVRHIEFKIPDNSSQEQKDQIKLKAEQVLQRIRAGESIEALALEFSDDLGSRASGGDLGWVSAGKMPKPFERAAFSLKDGGLGDLVDAGSAFHIIQVEEYRPAAPKPLSDVRAIIEQELRAQEAPAFVNEHAYALLEQWEGSKSSLAEFAAAQKLSVKSSDGLLTESQDPESTLAGITRKVLQDAASSKQVADIGDETLIVEVAEHRDIELPSLDQVRDTVVADWKKEQTVTRARSEAQGFLEEARGPQGWAGALNARKLTSATVTGVTRVTGLQEPLDSEEVSDLVFSIYTPATVGAEVVSSDSKFLVLYVDKIRAPSEEEQNSLRPRYEAQAPQQLGRVMVASLVAQLKAQSQVDIAPSLLSE